MLLFLHSFFRSQPVQVPQTRHNDPFILQLPFKLCFYPFRINSRLRRLHFILRYRNTVDWTFDRKELFLPITIRHAYIG